MNMNKKMLIATVASISVIIFFACTQKNVKPANEETTTKEVVKSPPKLKLDIDIANWTFNFFDVNSGEKLTFSKLIIQGNEVVETECLNGEGKGNSVLFRFEKSKKNTNNSNVGIAVKVNGTVISENKELKYKLEDEILTILD